MQTYNKTKALFLDRDGVININHGYVHKVEHFDFIDGIFELVEAANKAGFLTIVITNQAGIARGYYSEEDFIQLTDWMCQQFTRQGATINKVYYSPYHPTEGIGRYKKDDISRKPRPGMILNAKQDLNISLEQSILVGDQASDILAGMNAGVGLNVLISDISFKELEGVEFFHIQQLTQAIPLLNNKEIEKDPQ